MCIWCSLWIQELHLFASLVLEAITSLLWKYIYNECKKRDIMVATFSGDGDSRIMKAMKVSVSLFCSSNDALKAEVISTSPAQQNSNS